MTILSEHRPLPQAPQAEPKAARQRRRRGPLRAVLHYIGLGISLGLLAFVLLVGALVVVVPAATHSTPYTVLTSSMVPHYPPGTLVVIQSVKPQDIKIGDVITYQLRSGEPEVVTHRVVSIQFPSTAGGQLTFITKGDANSLPDSPAVKPVQIRGKLWYAVPYIGWINNVVNGGQRAAIVPVIAGLLFAYAGWMVIRQLLDVRRKRRAAAVASAAAEQLPAEHPDAEAEPR